MKDIAKSIARSRLLDSPHNVACAVRLHLAALSYLPAGHPKRVEHLKNLPVCDCDLSQGTRTLQLNVL